MTTRTRTVDLSPKAIAGRLEVVRGLYKLCMSLFAAGARAGLHHRAARPAIPSPAKRPAET